jgi:hypothetical protein
MEQDRPGTTSDSAGRTVSPNGEFPVAEQVNAASKAR